jgi:predicted DNA-binding protein YlxM (UPF0122 family)
MNRAATFTETTTLSMDEAADTIGISRRTLQDLIKTHPFYSMYKSRKRFSRSDIKHLHKALSCRSNLSNVTAPAPLTSEGA